jgi:hypothetical protein
MNAFDRYPPAARRRAADAEPATAKPIACKRLLDRCGSSGLAILIGLCAGIWAVAGLTVVKYWPAIAAAWGSVW